MKPWSVREINVVVFNIFNYHEEYQKFKDKNRGDANS